MHTILPQNLTKGLKMLYNTSLFKSIHFKRRLFDLFFNKRKVRTVNKL